MIRALRTPLARVLALVATAAGTFASPVHELYQLTHLQGGTVHGIHFISPEEGWTAEDGGRIRHWTFHDATESWTGELQKTPYDSRYLLRDVYFADPLNGWAVGYGGRVLRTLDGGGYWAHAGSGSQPFVRKAGQTELADLYSVRFYFDHAIGDWRGWLTGFGGILMRSDDGGRNWEDKLPSHLTGIDMYAIEIHESSSKGAIVWITGDRGLVLSSSDLGETWLEQSLPGSPTAQSGNNLELWDIDVLPDGRGSVVGGYGRAHGQMFRTSDYGESWLPEDCFDGGPRTVLLTMYGVSLDGSFDAISGGYGDQLVLRNDENGNHCWRERGQQDHLVGNPAVLGMSGLGGKHVWTAGDFNNIRASSDGGRSWSFVSKGLPLRLHTGTFVDTRTGFVAGQLAQILKTTDGGETWDTKYPETLEGGVQTMFSLAFSPLDKTRGVGVGRSIGGRPLVVWSADSGETWNEVQQLPVGGNGRLTDVAFDPASPERVWAVGNRGLVLASNDGGETWEEQSIPESKGRSNLRGVCVDAEGRVFAVGSDPQGSPTGGWVLEDETWSSLWLFDTDGREVTVDLRDVAASSLGVFAVGTGGAVLRLEQDGSFHAMFSAEESPLYDPTETLESVCAVDSTRCEALWVGGANGSLAVFDGTGWTLPKSGMSDTPVLGISALETPHGCVGYVIGRFFQVVRLARSDT